MSFLKKIPKPKSPETIYLITRVHGLRTHLFKPEDISSLSKASDLSVMVEALLKGDYAQDVSAIPSERINAVSLTEVFYKKLADRFYFLVKITKGSLREFFEAYAKRLEVENIKRILRAKHVKEIITEELLVPIPREHTVVNFPAMIEAKDLEESLGILKETMYAPLIDKIELYKRYNTTLIFEGLLDKIYFGELWKNVKKLSENDIKKRIGKEMDLKNLILILGLKAKNMPAELIEESLIEEYYKLDKKLISSLVKERPESIFDALLRTYYKNYFMKLRDEIEKGTMSEIEHSVFNSLYNEDLKNMHEKPFRLSFVISYLSLCEFEAKNITSIATAKQLGLSEDKLRSILYL
ncbi:MAG: V-type ATPase subunit [Nitrososphaerales archaeon]